MYTTEKLAKDFEQSKLFAFKDEFVNLDYVVKNNEWNIRFDNEQRHKPTIELTRHDDQSVVYELCVEPAGTMAYKNGQCNASSYYIKRNGETVFSCAGKWRSQAKTKTVAAAFLFSICLNRNLQDVAYITPNGLIFPTKLEFFLDSEKPLFEHHIFQQKMCEYYKTNEKRVSDYINTICEDKKINEIAPNVFKNVRIKALLEKYQISGRSLKDAYEMTKDIKKLYVRNLEIMDKLISISEAKKDIRIFKKKKTQKKSKQIEPYRVPNPDDEHVQQFLISKGGQLDVYRAKMLSIALLKSVEKGVANGTQNGDAGNFRQLLSNLKAILGNVEWMQGLKKTSYAQRDFGAIPAEIIVEKGGN